MCTTILTSIEKRGGSSKSFPPIPAYTVAFRRVSGLSSYSTLKVVLRLHIFSRMCALVPFSASGRATHTPSTLVMHWRYSSLWDTICSCHPSSASLSMILKSKSELNWSMWYRGECPTGQSAFREQLCVRLLCPLPPYHPEFPTLVQTSRYVSTVELNLTKLATDLNLHSKSVFVSLNHGRTVISHLQVRRELYQVFREHILVFGT